MADTPKKIVIIGGGITGLSAAFYIHHDWPVSQNGLRPEVTLIEATETLGGIIQTQRQDDYVIEYGPDSILTTKSEGLQLVDDLGLSSEVVGIPATSRGASIWRDGKLRRISPQFPLGVPTDFRAWRESDLVNGWGRWRVWLDLMLPGDGRIARGEDASLETVVKKRLGANWFYEAVEPLIGGVYAGDPAKLSAKATFPQLADALRFHGSLIRGMKKWQQQRREVMQSSGVFERWPQLKGSSFFTLRKGLGHMIETLVTHIQKMGMSIQMGQRVTSVRKADHGYCVSTTTGHQYVADHVIVAMPNEKANAMFDLPFGKKPLLKRGDRASVANVVLIFDKSIVPALPRGSGFVVPRTEHLSITACTFTSQKWPHSAPTNRTMIRTYIGRFEDASWMNETDEQLVSRAVDGLKCVLGSGWTEPLEAIVNRYSCALPQYPVGHLDDVARLRTNLEVDLPNVEFIGADYDGVGIPDCVRAAKKIVQKLFTLYPS